MSLLDQRINLQRCARCNTKLVLEETENGTVDYRCPNCNYLVVPLPYESWEELAKASSEEVLTKRRKQAERTGKTMKIYLAHPVSGLSWDVVAGYFEKTTKELYEILGNQAQIMSPLIGKEHLRCETKFRAHSYQNPLSTNHHIHQRDCWMVKRADLIYLNLTLATEWVSVGSVMELQCAYDHGVYSVVSMGEDNIHQHSFVLEAASLILPTHNEAMKYLKKLTRELQGKGEI